MRKLIICLAVASLAVSCKKIQAGGSKNNIKLEEGVERYSDDPQGVEGHGHEATMEHTEGASTDKKETPAPKADSTAAAKPTDTQKPKAEH
ncbi:hypothetical protein D1632_11865 [Chryseobacterium nematophagum]|uniref:Uncharacterized protein n=1 Tax=Chryseobacterium nematophagum TaxID=2305228 RepID=A0A3M7L6G6_9FLAO|nr:hypothetical protein [Chryseobacterium nematophagum]RMZ58318.1 hypothetical protein D1632_11865 [Chryseobacterium nematophagum]